MQCGVENGIFMDAGQSSSVLSARSGDIPGPLQGETESFKICN